jgi:hypothetical protein
MRDALLLLFSIIILLTIFVFLQHSTNSEGFSDLNKKHSNYITRQLKQYSNLGISLLAAKKDGALGASADSLLNTFGQKSSYPLNEGKGGLWEKIDKCETVKKTDCSAFDDPAFSKHCGICLDIGENSEKEKTTGGLLLLADDKQYTREKTQSNFLPDYKPTIGICPAKKMVSTKAECLRLQKQLLCEKNSSYDIPGCSSCYSSKSYSIIDEKTSPGVITGSGKISVVGVGLLKVDEQGFSSKDGIVLNPSTPYVINLRVKETGRVKFSLNPPRNSDPENPTLPYISGVLSGETATGTFTHDIRQIVLVDEVTGRKPRSSGKDTIEDTSVTRMSPGFGKTTAVIVVILPFSFVEQTMEEGSKCRDAPFITKQASAQFLDSDPCYKKGSGPGKYDLECLQGAWTSNGCTESGKGYPKDQASANKLMTSKDGSLLTINDISDYIYNQALISSTGIDNKGVKRQIKDQSEASVFCMGNEITSPCDTANKGSGPLTPDCIIYLWNNQGSKKLWTGKTDPVGPTYYASESVSEFSDGGIVRGCQATGTLSPIDDKGNRKKDIIQYWQKQGGVESVKKKMADLHRAANAQKVADDQLAPYFKQCYGDVPFASRPPTITPAAPVPVVIPAAAKPIPIVSKPSILNPPPTCSTNLLPLTYKVTANTVIVPTLMMSQDYKLEFDITPSSTGQAGAWRSIIHFTSDNSDFASFGSRTPAIWFVPGTMNLHVRVGDSTNLNWGFDSVPGCAVGRKSNVVLECKGTSVTLTIDTKSHSLTQPTFRYSGNVKVYGSDPWYPPADATVSNLCLKLSGNSYSPPVDSRQNMIFTNTNINGGGASVNRNLGNFPDMNACIAAGRRAYPDGNYAVTFAPGQCWAIGPTNPYDKHYNPVRGWTSAYFRAANEKLPGIEGVVRVQLAGGWGTCLNFSQLVVLNEKGENISRGRRTEGSGQWEPASSSARAVDGEEWPRGHPNEYHSSGAACGANVNHWQVTLDRPSTVSAVIIYNRADCCQDRLSKQNMHMFNSAGDLIYWKPTMGTALVNVLPTNGSTNRVQETKGNANMFCYSNRYPDLYNAFDKPYGPSSNHAGLLSHFNTYGRREGRNPNC